MFEEMLLKALLQGGDSDAPYDSEQQAAEALTNFMQMEKPEFQVGDQVKRNQYGVKFYKTPSENQAAIVAQILDEPKVDLMGQLYDMIIIVALAKDKFRHFPVNSRFYRKADDQKNVFKFKKK